MPSFMKKIQGIQVKQLLPYAKRALIAIVVLVVLRYTGLLSGFSYVATKAIVKSGAMDIDTDGNVTSQTFQYDFTLRNLKDEVVDVKSFRGKVIFLNMWATWCGPCRAEMPAIQQVYDSVRGDDVVFIMLSLDVAENQSKVARYVKDRDFTFPVYQAAGELPNQLRVPSIPTTFVIGKDGKIRMKKVGTANYATDNFLKFLKNLAAEEVPTSSLRK
jgi:thiol-disulfide isomerase/thioredoxin